MTKESVLQIYETTSLKGIRGGEVWGVLSNLEVVESKTEGKRVYISTPLVDKVYPTGMNNSETTIHVYWK